MSLAAVIIIKDIIVIIGNRVGPIGVHKSLAMTHAQYPDYRVYPTAKVFFKAA